MCSEYQTKTSPKEVVAALGVPVLNHAKTFEWGGTVKAFNKDPSAPVIVQNGSDFELVTKIFPASPFPNSRLSGLEGQSDANDKDESDGRQIERIYDKPRWKKGFETKPILAVMSEFTEFAYWGEAQGTAVAFKIPDEKVIFAAAIGIKPFKPVGSDGDAFSLLTHTATKQMLKFHQRLIVIFEAKKAAGYLEPMTSKQRFDYAIENRYTGELDVRELRKMAASYKTRIPVQTAKLNRELVYREVLKTEGVHG